MAHRTKVAFKLCGNCNPHIPTGDLFRSIKTKANFIKQVEFVSKDDPEVEVLIVISGCPADCAERQRGKYREIIVAGETVNRINCLSEGIADKVIKELNLNNA